MKCSKFIFEFDSGAIFDNKINLPNITLRLAEIPWWWFWPRINLQIHAKSYIFSLFSTEIVLFASKFIVPPVVLHIIWCNKHSHVFFCNFLHHTYYAPWEMYKSVCDRCNSDTKTFGVRVSELHWQNSKSKGWVVPVVLKMKVTVLKHNLHLSEGTVYRLFKFYSHLSVFKWRM